MKPEDILEEAINEAIHSDMEPILEAYNNDDSNKLGELIMQFTRAYMGEDYTGVE